MGDSFTEGLWDSPEGPDAPQRGWADVLAGLLSDRRRAAGAEPLRYANLAVRGRLLRPIVTEQVPAALALEPDLVSVIGGGNDILRPTADVDRLARELERAVVRIRATGADVLLATGFDAAGSALVQQTRSRTALYNTHVWSIARRHGAYVLDLWGMRHLRDVEAWAPDRIHLTTEAHARVAQGALVGLGLRPDHPGWDAPRGPHPRPSRAEQAREDARWLRTYAYPWATRRLRRVSSGDDRQAKLATLTEV
ncbi:MAG TPA: SGNH/GDSL hydrolase family protein [Cellulomonas sp.]